MSGLLKGELLLTLDIVIGLVIAEVILRLRLPELVMRRLIPRSIPPVTALAVAVSAGSSKAGAAILSQSLARNEITERAATWSVLMLPMPSYLRRWPSTFALSVSMAGTAGGIFAVSLLLRSVLRFMFALYMVRREGAGSCVNPEITGHVSSRGIIRRLAKTLPLSWVLFGAAYSLVPIADEFFRSTFSGSILPLSGWTVAAASLGHVSSALSLAGGAMEAGTLSMTQALFALVLGSALGTATRILRQNAGYYYGLFPKSTATKMLVMNFATVMPLLMMNLLFAGLALSLCS